MKTTKEILERAKQAESAMRAISSDDINRALTLMADALVLNTEKILSANREDVSAAEETVGAVMVDRLMLNATRISSMADGIRKIVTLPTPLGEVLEEHTAENGLIISKVSVPLGVLAIIYESRPNVTSDAAALAIKSGNAVILRSGKEAHRTSAAIVEVIKDAISEAGLPRDAVQLIEDTSRESARELMTARGYVDMLIPRGGKGLIKACVEGATVPTLETGTGICHIYVDAYCDTEKAIKIVYNAKTSRPSVCNAAEVCLVHEDIAEKFLPDLKCALVDERILRGERPVKLIVDERAARIIDGIPAGEDDFDTEFLDYTLAIGIVRDVRAAVSHIAKHSTHHSEAIITECCESAKYFIESVDSAAVYHNASTRFTDGGEFGLGCEMGISTQKLHARGPLGIRELTTYKYVIRGTGQTR